MSSAHDGERSWQWLAVLAVAAFAVILPFLIWGNPGGSHDIYFHANSWMDAGFQLRHGTLFPRWAVQADFGYGEPRFVFYPPLSWLLGGTLSLILPWQAVPGAFVWLALFVSGFSMYLLARDWLPPAMALLAALVYLANPYQLMVVYWRFAASELLAAAFFPLLLCFALRLAEDHRPQVAPAAMAFAAIWLTNAPAAVIASYSLAALFAVTAIRRRRVRPLALGGAAIALGLALAAFYIVPAAWEQRWVHIERVMDPSVAPENNFLTWVAPRIAGVPMNWRFKGAAAGNIGLAVAVVLIAVRRRRLLPKLWAALAVLVLFASFLMFPSSEPLWRYLPKMRFVQLPWRWLYVVNAVAAFLLAALCQRFTRKARIAAVAFVVILFGVMMGVARIKHGYPGHMNEVREIAGRVGGYGGYGEYLPIGDSFHVHSGDGLFTSGGSTRPLPLSRTFRRGAMLADAQAPAAGMLQLPVNWYPAWRAEVNGVAAPVDNQDGLVTVPLAGGANRIVLHFAATGDSIAGVVISLPAWLTVVVLALYRRKRAQVDMMSSSSTTAPAT
jgi:hypothetical protein